ncbi:MAG: DUF167 domain-containing protein [Candidatus Rokuibacteriota bacterium]|nr:MAG: DUF167 domain-containing protein [Candidatus Rokubacteria bacterium]
MRTPASRRPEGALLHLRVQPRASRDEILGWQDGVLRVRVAAPPVEGEANAAVVALVARALRIAPSTVRVVRGKRGRDKLVRLTGLGDDEAQSRLASLPGYPRLTTTSRSPQ